MSERQSSLGAPDATVIRGELTLEDGKVLSEAAARPGSDMLLRLTVTAASQHHTFVVGGYWSDTGFRLTSMLKQTRISPEEDNYNSGIRPVLYGVGFENPSSVWKDRIQQLVNQQRIGRPDHPSAACRKAGFYDGVE